MVGSNAYSKIGMFRFVGRNQNPAHRTETAHYTLHPFMLSAVRSESTTPRFQRIERRVFDWDCIIKMVIPGYLSNGSSLESELISPDNLPATRGVGSTIVQVERGKCMSSSCPFSLHYMPSRHPTLRYRNITPPGCVFQVTSPEFPSVPDISDWDVCEISALRKK